MPESVPKLGQILTIAEQGEKKGDSVQRDLQQFRDRVVEEIKKVRWTAKMPALFGKIAELLDIPLPGIMIAAWEKSDEIKKTLGDSRDSPEDTFSVELVEHTLSTEFHPEIEIQVSKFPPKVLQFVVQLTLELSGIELEIKGGQIRRITTGSCEAGGKLLYDDIVLAERTLSPFKLPGEIDCSPLEA